MTNCIFLYKKIANSKRNLSICKGGGLINSFWAKNWIYSGYFAMLWDAASLMIDVWRQTKLVSIMGYNINDFVNHNKLILYLLSFIIFYYYLYFLYYLLFILHSLLNKIVCIIIHLFITFNQGVPLWVPWSGSPPEQKIKKEMTVISNTPSPIVHFVIVITIPIWRINGGGFKALQTSAEVPFIPPFC